MPGGTGLQLSHFVNKIPLSQSRSLLNRQSLHNSGPLMGLSTKPFFHYPGHTYFSRAPSHSSMCSYKWLIASTSHLSHHITAWVWPAWITITVLIFELPVLCAGAWAEQMETTVRHNVAERHYTNCRLASFSRHSKLHYPNNGLYANALSVSFYWWLKS